MPNDESGIATDFARDLTARINAAFTACDALLAEKDAEIARIRTGHVCDDRCAHTMSLCDRCNTYVGGRHPRMECDVIAQKDAEIVRWRTWATEMPDYGWDIDGPIRAWYDDAPGDGEAVCEMPK